MTETKTTPVKKNTRQERVDVVNKIIAEIASLGRTFFKFENNVAIIFIKNGRLYMKNEYNGKDMCLSTKNGYPPKHWSHGGTLWGLTKDFKDFIMTGEKTNHNNGYGGLYSPHWGYEKEDMLKIQKLALQLNYL